MIINDGLQVKKNLEEKIIGHVVQVGDTTVIKPLKNQTVVLTDSSVKLPDGKMILNEG